MPDFFNKNIVGADMSYCRWKYNINKVFNYFSRGFF